MELHLDLAAHSQTSEAAAAQWRKAKLVESFQSQKPARRRSEGNLREKPKSRVLEEEPSGQHVEDRTQPTHAPESSQVRGESAEKAEKGGAMVVVPPIWGSAKPKRRRSAPDMERKKEIMSAALKHWMTEGGMAIRNKAAARKKLENEKQFRGLPWRCTVCYKEHYKTVKDMQEPRCLCCSSERDSKMTPVQRFRDNLVAGDWVEVMKHRRSGWWLARIERIRTAVS